MKVVSWNVYPMCVLLLDFSFAKKYLIPAGYEWINRDTLKDTKKCLKRARECLEQEKSVVIDNTNPNPDKRKDFIDIAKKLGG